MIVGARTSIAGAIVNASIINSVVCCYGPITGAIVGDMDQCRR